MSLRAPLGAPLAVAALALVGLVPARAHANASWQLVGNAAVGWTDNVLSAPNDPMPGMRGRESDFFFQLAPGVALTTASPRFISRVAYTLTGDIFVLHGEGDAYTNTLDWSAFSDLSRAVDLLLVAQSQQGRLSMFNLSTGSAQQQPGVLPANTQVNFFSQLFMETIGWSITPQWHTWQTGTFRAFIPTDRGQLADSYEGIGELGGERSFKFDALGLVLRADFVDFVGPVDSTGMKLTPDQQQLISSAGARWRRDWSPSWSTELDAGVVEAEPLDVPGASRVWQPNGLAALRYFNDRGSGELRYQHDIMPNPAAGASFLYDEVALNASVPLGQKSKFFLSATVSYQYAQALNQNGSVSGTHAHVAAADVSLDYQPRPEIGIFARYSLFDQLATNEVSTDPTMAAPFLPSMLRNVVMLGVSVLYPAVAVAKVPTRRGTRVDKADQPGIPAAHTQPPPTR